MKAIVFVRCSTEHQELESQKKETVAYAKDLGYDEHIIIGKLGASAYKVSKLYLEMIEEMKHTIETDPDIKAVVVWHLNRLARNDEQAIAIKNFLIDHKVQLCVKEPTIKLLNDDGTVNDGAELAFSIFATMNKQQISELRAKTKRAKKRDKALHKFIGGLEVPFGYTVVDRFVQPHPTNAAIVSEIFDLYATGEYSYPELAQEINERYGTDLHHYSIHNFLSRTAYYDNTKYPPIITELQYNKALEQRKNSAAKPTGYKHHTFANKLIRCKCGRGYTFNDRKYLCSRPGCNAPSVSAANLDGLLWTIASHLEGERLLNSSAKDEYRQKIAVLEAKISGVAQSLTKGTKRAEKAKKMCLSDLLSIEEYQDILKEVEEEQKGIKEKEAAWKAEVVELQRLIEEDSMSVQRILNISDNITSSDEAEMRTIVRRWVKCITFEDNVFTIETLTRTYKAVYNCYGWVSKWYTLNNKPLVIAPVNRIKGDCKLGAVHTRPVDVVTTLAWLNGSEII